jgi:hypothetical protein
VDVLLLVIASRLSLPERAPHRRRADDMPSAVPFAQHVAAVEPPMKVRAGQAALCSRWAVDSEWGEVGERSVHGLLVDVEFPLYKL